ncbi:nicotinate-nucleotide adenylyltransferase [Acetobacteraceae bacterium KSS12]|uniref:Probable nicotinate-nucleotide adenylyltransferase n=2 Tax=Rhizosaccharibacter radicis TaxID=2782605 RepID=A0ABT1VZG6_9PROT|nr:nicotinate-nucleotide adenylyltransferase [Acetobacteraceae bacterium KSS12]
MRVGLLGGSFNPAHEGHRRLADLMRRRLRLDQVWLLVSPGNPLKPAIGMAPLAERLAGAEAIADGRRIVATDLERELGTRFAVDTVRALRRRFPRVRFVWLMGADVLAELPRWRRWTTLARDVPFAVLPRPSYNHRALSGRAAHRLRPFHRPGRQATMLADAGAPGWTFLPARQMDISATSIRARTARGRSSSPGV